MAPPDYRFIGEQRAVTAIVVALRRVSSYFAGCSWTLHRATESEVDWVVTIRASQYAVHHYGWSRAEQMMIALYRWAGEQPDYSFGCGGGGDITTLRRVLRMLVIVTLSGYSPYRLRAIDTAGLWESRSCEARPAATEPVIPCLEDQ